MRRDKGRLKKLFDNSSSNHLNEGLGLRAQNTAMKQTALARAQGEAISTLQQHAHSQNRQVTDFHTFDYGCNIPEDIEEYF